MGALPAVAMGGRGERRGRPHRAVWRVYLKPVHRAHCRLGVAEIQTPLGQDVSNLDGRRSVWRRIGEPAAVQHVGRMEEDAAVLVFQRGFNLDFRIEHAHSFVD